LKLRTGKRLRKTLRAAGAGTLLATASFCLKAHEVPVVATFSILGDMVQQIGGDHVSVTSLVGPDGDNHVFQPTPADAVAIAKAKVLVVNGLEFEGWMERLLEAADFKGVLVTASDGVAALEFKEGDVHHGDSATHGEHEDTHDHGKKAHKEEHDHDHDGHKKAHKEEHDDHKGHAHHGHGHGEFDPHAWQDVANAKIYSRNIAAGLAKADPKNAAHYREHLSSYTARLNALDAEIKAEMAKLPKENRAVVTSHDAFQYFGRAYGLTFLSPQGISTESEASAADVANLIRQIRKERIKAVFIENLSDSRLIQRIAEETGAKVGGTLYPGALSTASGPAPTYLEMMRENARVIRRALE